MSVFGRSIVTAALLAVIIAPTAHADAVSNFSVQWFGVNNQQGVSGNAGTTETPDFYNSATNSSYPIGVSTNYVTSSLGSHGLPVYNPSATASSGTIAAPAAASLVSGTSEINWWSPTYNSNVIAKGTGTLALTSGSTNMFVPGQSGDSTYFATAILTGYFNTTGVSTSVQFSVGADDTTFVYVDGALVETLGGLHLNTAAPSNVVNVGVGTHKVQIFYADRATSGATLSFSEVSGAGLSTPTITATAPEPSSIALFGMAALGLLGFSRRRLFAG